MGVALPHPSVAVPAPSARTGPDRAPHRPARRKQRAYAYGVKAETRAAALLVSKGYRIVGQRVLLPQVEIDLVAVRGDVVAFVEVKARESIEDALDAVSARLRRRIVAASQEWLARNPAYLAHVLRFDIVAVAPWRMPRHVPNAFWDEG